MLTYIHYCDIFIYVKPVHSTDYLTYEIEPHKAPNPWFGGATPFHSLIGR